MKIKRIKTIKSYKSFSDFSWAKFCQNASGQEEVLQKFTLVFGENGSGKSSICDVLKSLSQTQEFQNGSPDLAEVEVIDGSTTNVHKYENGNWTSQINRNRFLFFDVDFINANVHTHGLRSSNLQQGAHTQKAGKLIIDLDEQANNLKELVRLKKSEVEDFQKSCSESLSLVVNDKDQEFFQTFKEVEDQVKKDKITQALAELKKVDADLVTLQKINKEHAEISKINPLNQVSFSPAISSKEEYLELFTREIKEKAQDEADIRIKAHFEKHKRFIESAKDYIPDNYKDENCPLCMQPLAGATNVVDYYKKAFDQTYESAKRKFLADIQSVKDELNVIKINSESFPGKVASIFDNLEKIKTDFEIQELYKLEEKTEYVKKINDFSLSELDKLLDLLEGLKSIERKTVDIGPLYDSISLKLAEFKKTIQSLSELIEAKNKAISEFKNKYSDQSKITTEIQEKSKKQTELTGLIDFLKSEKIKQINNKNEALAKQKTLTEELKKTQEDLRLHLANTIPESVISQMIAILGKFNLSFTLEHIKSATNTRDYSFSFKVKDQKGHEREFKDGLSEGERQLVSLAFFFAINESLPNKQDTVLVFDDPITSLDAPNLKILAELIHGKAQDFSQVIVFTHHPLFFKYVAKCENPHPAKFGILKNAESFGGSFMFFDPGFDLSSEMQKCNEEISQNAQSGSLKPEEIALKYGQLLRLAVERFIKNDLLMWDKEKKFDEVTDGLKQGNRKLARLTDDDLEVMTNMYKYCNYSNLLHADKEIPSALSELMSHIDRFVKIMDKVNSPPAGGTVL